MKLLKFVPERYRQIMLYLFFGGCTTLVNLLVYRLCYHAANLSNLLSTCLAWFFSVLFAFVSNRSLVFESEARGLAPLLRECLSFFACRLATGALDVLIMVVAVDYLHRNDFLWKIISNIIVIALNYGASKALIFRKKAPAAPSDQAP